MADDWQPVAQQSGDWQPVGSPAHRAWYEQLLGMGGPRYQTWPERMARDVMGGVVDAAALPGRYVQEQTQPKSQISDSDVSVLSAPQAANFAAAASPISAAARAGEGAGLIGSQLVKEAPQPPTAGALKQAATEGYSAARNAGLEIRPDAVSQMATGIKTGLEQDGVLAELAPKTHAIINKLTSPPDGSFATVGNLESVRRSLQLAARDFGNPTEQLAASRAINGLDGFLENLNPASVMAGPTSAAPGMGAIASPLAAARPSPEDVASILRNARGNYAAAQRSNSLTGELDRANTGILERAETRAQAANSGRNFDNTIRSKIASLLERPKEVSGFSDPEIAALNGAVTGGPIRNAARLVGNELGGGGGVGQFMVAGAAGGGGALLGGAPGAAIGAAAPIVVGTGSKAIANALAKRSLNKVDELVRTRSPLYQEMLDRASVVPDNLEKKAAIARALLMDALSQYQQ